MAEKKCKCGARAEWHFGKEHYCQECWEALADKNWWETDGGLFQPRVALLGGKK